MPAHLFGTAHKSDGLCNKIRHYFNPRIFPSDAEAIYLAHKIELYAVRVERFERLGNDGEIIFPNLGEGIVEGVFVIARRRAVARAEIFGMHTGKAARQKGVRLACVVNIVHTHGNPRLYADFPKSVYPYIMNIKSVFKRFAKQACTFYDRIVFSAGDPARPLPRLIFIADGLNIFCFEVRQARIYADEKIRYVGVGIAVDKIGKVLFGKRGYTRLRSRIYKMIRVFIENQAHIFSLSFYDAPAPVIRSISFLTPSFSGKARYGSDFLVLSAAANASYSNRLSPREPNFISTPPD